MARAAGNFRAVLVMASSQDEALKIAGSLVDEKLAACVNIIGPARSIYRWQGKIEDASEYMLLIKTRSSHFSKVAKRVNELHSYDLPEVIAMPLAAGTAPYLEWLAESTSQHVSPRAPDSRRKRGSRSKANK